MRVTETYAEEIYFVWERSKYELLPDTYLVRHLRGALHRSRIDFKLHKPR